MHLFTMFRDSTRMLFTKNMVVAAEVYLEIALFKVRVMSIYMTVMRSVSVIVRFAYATRCTGPIDRSATLPMVSVSTPESGQRESFVTCLRCLQQMSADSNFMSGITLCRNRPILWNRESLLRVVVFSRWQLVRPQMYLMFTDLSRWQKDRVAKCPKNALALWSECMLQIML